MLRDILNNADPEVRMLLANLLSERILSSDSSEEEKIDVRIHRTYRGLQDKLHDAYRGFAFPIPAYLEEGKALQKELYPGRKAFHELLESFANELERFLQENPIPEYPEFVKAEHLKEFGEEL